MPELQSGSDQQKMRSDVPVFGCALALFLFLGHVKSKGPLYVGGILGSTDDNWSKYANFYNILFQVAFEEIGRTDILPNHELVFESKNSKVTLYHLILSIDWILKFVWSKKMAYDIVIWNIKFRVDVSNILLQLTNY